MTQQDPGPLAAGAGPPGLPSAGPLPASLDPALAQALVDVLPAPFIFLDGEDRCRLVNRAFERLLGCGREHIVGCTLEQFCAPGQPAFLRREVHAGPWQEEVQLQGSRGVTDVLFCLAPLVDEAGQVRGHVGIAVDLTAHRQVEQRLVEAARAAEDASRAKSRFLSSMSHEIRTPLTSIIGLSGLLLETTLTSEQREYANTVLASGNLLLGVITDILDLSKIEAGSLQLEEIEIDLCEVLGEVADLESRRAQQKGLELAVFIHPEVPACVSGDPIRVRQVLLNFLGNAVKFTENGEVMLEVRVQDEAPDQVVLRFAVHDTGIGVDPERQRLLFQDFRQADASIARKYGGSGLGLAIARRLAEMMGGSVGIDSEEGSGSTFWAAIPFRCATGGARAIAALPSGVSERRHLLGPMHPATRRVLESYLAWWQCPWESVLPSGEEADSVAGRLSCALADRSDAATVFIDPACVPAGHLDDVLEALRGARGEGRGPAVVLLKPAVAGARAPDLEGFVGYLGKPVRVRQLHFLLCRSVKASSAAPRPASAPPAPPRRPGQGSVGRILVVEDDETNQRVTVQMLEKLGVRVDAVGDGQKALEALREETYDVVLMDVELPGMDGCEITVAIRGAEAGVRNPAVPIIAMTAHALASDRDRCLEVGMNAYLAKPMRRLDLLEAISPWVRIR